jgi:hypothetical protein
LATTNSPKGGFDNIATFLSMQFLQGSVDRGSETGRLARHGAILSDLPPQKSQEASGQPKVKLQRQGQIHQTFAF